MVRLQVAQWRSCKMIKLILTAAMSAMLVLALPQSGAQAQATGQQDSKDKKAADKKAAADAKAKKKAEAAEAKAKKKAAAAEAKAKKKEEATKTKADKAAEKKAKAAERKEKKAKASEARKAMLTRQKQCAGEWKDAKAAGKVDRLQTWPKFWSDCDKRLKAKAA